MGTAALVTVEQLLLMPDCRWLELVAGRLRRIKPGGWWRGVVLSRLSGRLSAHVRKHKLGIALAGDAGFILGRGPDTVLGADIAFIRRERLSAAPPGDTFWPGAPDLAVEVVSPGDSASEVDEKAHMWLDAGAAIVWVVDPTSCTVTVYRPGADPQALTEGDDLDAPDLLPGFRCRIADLFAAP